MRGSWAILVLAALGCAPISQPVTVDGTAQAEIPVQGAAHSQASADKEVFIGVELPRSQLDALREGGALPIDAEFTLTGVPSAEQIPAGVVQIVALTSDGKSMPVGLVSLRAPFDDEFRREIRIDLASGLNGADIADAAENGTLQLGFLVETNDTSSPIGLESVSARVSPKQ